MKFSVEQSKIFNILKATKGVVAKHAIQPILACYKIDVIDSSVKVTATDLDNQISGTCSARTEGIGSFCIDGTKLTEIVAKLSGIIDFETDENVLYVRNGRTKYKMITIDSSEFPKDATDFEYQSTALPENFVTKTKQVIFCTQATDMRNIISGVCFDIEDCKLNLVATDGNRLSLVTMDIEAVENNRFVVPQRILQELIKNDYDNIYLAFGDNRVLFICDNMMFTTKVLNGEFPKYKALLPKSFKGVVKANTKEFRDAMSRTCVMTDDKTLKVEFKINNNSLRMSATSTDFGDSNDCIDVNSNIDDEMTIRFNSAFINNFLNATKEEEITIGLNDVHGAAMFKGDFDYLCMPLQ